jgi:hypothetical protein
MVMVPLAVLVAGLPQAVAAAPGSQCTEDVELVNGAGCFAPCCFQDPPNSGHYVFAHGDVEEIYIRGNDSSVVSVSFPNLQSVEREVRISYNQPASITSISFPSLTTAGALEVIGNPGLVEIDLPRLSSLHNEDDSAYLEIQSNAALETLNAPLLNRVVASEAGSAYVQIRYNQVLEEIDLPLLRTVEATEDYAEAYVFIQSNDLVRQVSMDDLRRLSAGSESISYMVIDELPQLEELSFPQLTELLPTGGPYDFSELTIGHSPNLTDFVFPSLERVTLLQLTGLKGTSRAMFPRLSELQYLWVFRSCADFDSTLKMYVCSDQPLYDFTFNNDDGLCGPTGYMLHSSSSYNEAACDSSGVCESFTPELDECRCDAVGLCML